jgi:hypothetical protein
LVHHLARLGEHDIHKTIELKLCEKGYRKLALKRVVIMAARRGAAVADGFQPAELLAAQTRQAWARVQV